MQTVLVKFLGSDCDEMNRCFVVGQRYAADVSSAGNYMLFDRFGDTWVIDPDDDDFAIE